MTTDQLITALVIDATPSRPFGRLFRYATAIGMAGAGLIFFSAIGPRQDLAAALETWRFLFKFVITVPLAIAATLSVSGMARPGRWHEYRPLPLMAPLGLLVIAALFELFMLPRSLWMVRLVGSNSVNCMTLIPLLAVSPLVAFLMVLRRGAPRDPGRVGAVAGPRRGHHRSIVLRAQLLRRQPALRHHLVSTGRVTRRCLRLLARSPHSAMVRVRALRPA